ncbi:MAG: prolipoprotein diacylglyceryl transferase, partial [Candidatus Omnitrophica bacterium]|nr:prolipoprotein diacylglyceryl transferase [Candidatus Omnitrophota bacterium]
MCPVIFKLGPISIYSYGLMVGLAFFVILYLIIFEAKRRNLNTELVFNLYFLVFILGIIGARIFFVMENFSYYQEFFWEIPMLWQGGLSWFGGFLSGLLGGIAYLKKKNIPVYPILDLFSPYLALGQSIG